jgi:hypothetical protein
MPSGTPPFQKRGAGEADGADHAICLDALLDRGLHGGQNGLQRRRIRGQRRGSLWRSQRPGKWRGAADAPETNIGNRLSQQITAGGKDDGQPGQG